MELHKNKGFRGLFPLSQPCLYVQNNEQKAAGMEAACWVRWCDQIGKIERLNTLRLILPTLRSLNSALWVRHPSCKGREAPEGGVGSHGVEEHLLGLWVVLLCPVGMFLAIGTCLSRAKLALKHGLKQAVVGKEMSWQCGRSGRIKT